jgi:hypothetical protein
MAFTAVCFVTSSAAAQTPGPARRPGRAARPALFFRGEWKPAASGDEAAVNPAEAVGNPNLELKLYGPGAKDIQPTGVAQSDSNPLLLVGDHADGSTVDWHENEFSIADVRWRELNIAKVVTTGDWVNNPDLSKVDEIGFTDLLPGSGHGPGGWSGVGKIEVYGKPVKR